MFDTALAIHLAELSKLEFTDEELEIITKEMNDIVALMDTVSEFSAGKSFDTFEPIDFEQLREDNADESMEIQDIIANAKDNGVTYFKAPKVV